MGLIHPAGPSFAHWSDNFGGLAAAQTSDSYGTFVTPGTSNADGSTVTLMPALAHDCEYLILGFNGFGEPAKSMRCIADILVDPAGGTSWSNLISGLLVGQTEYGLFLKSGSFTDSAAFVLYHFPLWIPAGASLGVRAKTSDAAGFTSSTRVWAVAAGGNKHPASWWCGQKVETLGSVRASSTGTAVANGVSASFGSWVNVGSASSARGGALQFMARGTTGTSLNNQYNVYEFGIAGTAIGPRHYGGQSTSTTIHNSLFSGPVFLDTPSGTQFQARGMSSHSGGNALDCCVYVVQ